MLRVYALILLTFLTGLTAFSQAVGDYRSEQSGNWSNTSTWGRWDGGSWVTPAPSAPTSADGIVTVRATHTVSIVDDITLDQVIVEDGAILEIDPNVNFSTVNVIVADGSGTDLTINGQLNLLDDFFSEGALISVEGQIQLTTNGAISINDPSLSTITFQSGSSYEHQRNGGTIPSSTWLNGSTCSITGVTSTAAPNGMNQEFYNLTWNSSSSGNVNLGVTNLTVNGDFQIAGTGSTLLVFNQSGSGTVDVMGNLIVSGMARFATTATGIVTLNIGGNFVFTSTGASSVLGSNGGTSSVNIAGDFTYSAGLLAKTGASGTSTITFNGSTAQTFTGGGSTITTPINYVVSSGSILDLGIYALTGTGSFTLNTTSVLRLGSLNASGALQTGTSNGNLRVSGTRTFSAGSTITYNGTAAQVTGNGLSSASNSNITINNTNGVTMNAALTIAASRLLTITSGSTLSIGTNTLTINGDISTSGGLGFFAGSNTSNLVIGGSGAMTDFIAFSSSGTAVLNNFTINRSSGTVYFRSQLTTVGAFTHTAGDMEMLGFRLTLDGDYTHTAGNFIMNGSSGLWVENTGTLDPVSFSTGSAVYDLNMNRTATVFTLGSDLSVNQLLLNAGTVNNSSATLTMDNGGTLTRRAGDMTAAPVAAGSYNVIYDNSGTLTSSFELPSGSTTLSSLTKSNTGTLNLNSDITINGDLFFTGSGFTASSHTITMNGSQITSSATSSLASSSFIFAGTTTLIGGLTPVSPTFGNITVSGTLTPNLAYGVNGNLINNGTLGANDVTFGGTTTISGTSTSSFNVVTISGTLTAPTGTMNVAGNFTNNGTFNRNGGTINFNGTTTIGGSNASTFSAITITGTLTSPTTLSLTRNFTNNGTFNHNNGTLAFTGTSQQLIQGSTVTTFNNITTTNNGGPPSISVETSANLIGVLSVTNNGIFDADGSANSSVFTLLSTNDSPTADAGIAELTGSATVTGNVRYQRYMSIEGGAGGNGRIYRYISSPVSGATVADLQGEIPVTGSFTGTSSCSGCSTNQSMWTYDETVLGDKDQGFVDFPSTSNTETFQPTVGYILFVRGNVLSTPVWDLTGPINSGTFDFGIDFTSTGNSADDGWNLVGNPYPSTIDWDDAGWTKTNITNVIYSYDNGAGTITSYNGTMGVNGGTNLIASGQAFYVQSSAASPFLIATEAVKTAGTSTTFFRKEAPQNFIRIALIKGNQKDEIAIHFREDALEGFDNVDARKLPNTSVHNLASLASDGLKLAINSLPNIDCSRQIPLSITEVKPGNYQFKFSELSSFTNAATIKLIDNYANFSKWISQDDVYNFTVTNETASYGSERFSLLFTLPDFDPDFSFTTADVCKDSNARIMIEQSNPQAVYTVRKGEEMVSEKLQGNGNVLSIEIDKEMLSTGENALTINSVAEYCSSMGIDKQVVINVESLPTLETVTASKVCLSGSSTLTASGASTGVYNWYKSETSDTPIEGQHTSNLMTEELIKSKTYYVAGVNNLGCEGERKAVTAEVIYYDPVEITETETGNFKSNQTTGNQWYLDDVLLDGENNQEITPINPGIYSVKVTHDGGCVSANERVYLITENGESFSSEISVYPVPVNDLLTVKIPETMNVKEITLINNLGQRVMQIPVKQDGNIDMHAHAPGLYSLNIYLVDGRIAHFKVLKK